MVTRLFGKSLLLWVFTLANILTAPSVWAVDKSENSTEVAEASNHEREQPTTSVTEWLAQIEEAIIQITKVQVNPTAQGLSIILETGRDELSVPTTTAQENRLTAVIPNAVLALPDGPEYRQLNPATGIAEVSVTSLTADQVTVEIVGTDAPPTVSIQNEDTGLVLVVDAAAQAISEDEEIDVTVTAEKFLEGYVVPDASTATRTDTPILDTPASIQVIPKQVLEEQQVIRLEDALSNLSGVTYGGNFAGLDVNFNIRGFDNVPILRDGFRQFGFGNDGIPETANLERIEVLRGPASILYGEIQPGGVINLVTEKPLADPTYEAQLQIGNRGLISPQIDLTGPLTSDNRLLYRLNVLYRNEESFRDYEQNIERIFVAPTLSWKISDQTDLTVQLEYSDYSGPFEVGLPVIGNRVADVPASRVAGELEDFSDIEFLRVGYDLEHRFNDRWKVQNTFRFTRRDILNTGAIPLFFFDEANGILGRGLSRQVRNPQDFSLQTSVIGKFATGPVDHTLLFGVDLNRSEERDTAQFSDFADFQPLNIFAPVYGTFNGVNPGELPVFRDEQLDRDRLGIYLQDQIDLLDNLILVAGLRYETVKETVTSFPNAFDPNTTETIRNDDAWIPRFGLVYQPIPNLSLYGSYSQSFTPNFGTTSAGDPLAPERGEGFEVGIKTELWDGNFLATLGYFDVTRQNVATSDPNDPFALIATGEQNSQGIELDIVGKILPGWNILASYAYTDAKVTADNDIPVGNRVFNTPEHSASLWTTYTLQSGTLEGLGFGLGFNFVGDRAGDLANTFDVESYFLTNAAIFYRRDNWRVNLSIRNLFDVDYIAATQNSRESLNEPGAPFTIVGSVAIQF
ncbi:TonB-dependent siderophore receptor [Acaryochloris marina]|uniref:TonB-dependent siderophore receptor protein n=1 Tax=Acaryochloris marina (strain MBIC 11017) TaxID=329726 RepID=A8ZKK2_ACAM1|nr:TonB-dependent siderophore receptor [Acaryochloris marina]ABW31702.1 TonB-dependent siderophore receptor protein [Acaryochloris marina MBIC11017]